MYSFPPSAPLGFGRNSLMTIFWYSILVCAIGEGEGLSCIIEFLFEKFSCDGDGEGDEDGVGDGLGEGVGVFSGSGEAAVSGVGVVCGFGVWGEGGSCGCGSLFIWVTI